MIIDEFRAFDVGFTIFSIMFIVAFVLIFGVFLVAIIRTISVWNKNNHSPQLSVYAKVVSKRQDISHHDHGDTMHHHSSTSYYVTFEVESGDRLEFYLNGNEYGLLVEGDTGMLTFQGTRYLGFERIRNE